MTRGKRLILIAGIVLAHGGAGAGESEADSVRSAREALARWVETRQILSKERQEWELGREVLEQRIQLIEGETGALQKRIAEANEAMADGESTRRELQGEQRALRDAAALLQRTIVDLEERTRRLLVALPDPIRERVGPLSGRIPAVGAETRLSLGQRFQNVIGILNEVNKFNRAVTLVSEVRSLPDGSAAEVQALYVGLGQAYYVTPNGEAAGIGRPGPDGWEWTAADELAPDVARAIQILQNEAVPAYVPLPVEIR